MYFCSLQSTAFPSCARCEPPFAHCGARAARALCCSTQCVPPLKPVCKGADSPVAPQPRHCVVAPWWSVHLMVAQPSCQVQGAHLLAA